jgi:hypothetical protein
MNLMVNSKYSLLGGVKCENGELLGGMGAVLFFFKAFIKAFRQYINVTF